MYVEARRLNLEVGTHYVSWIWSKPYISKNAIIARHKALHRALSARGKLINMAKQFGRTHDIKFEKIANHAIDATMDNIREQPVDEVF